MNNPPQKFSLKFPIILIIFLYFNNLIKAHLTDNEQIFKREKIEEKWSEVDEVRSENEKSVNDNDYLFKNGKNGEGDNKEEVFEEKESLFSFVKAKEEIKNEEEEEENNGEEEDWVINKGFGRREEEEEERKEIREDESQSNFLNNFYENNKWNNNDDNDGQFKFWQWTENYMPKMGGGRWWEMWGREENNEEESNNNWNKLMENKWKIDNKWKDENYVNKEYNNNNGFIPINGLLPRINGQYWKGFNEIEDKNEIEKINKEKTIEEVEEEEKNVEEEKFEVEEEENKKEENNNGRFSWGGIFNRNENNGERKGNCWWKKILNGIGNVAKMFVKEETSNEENGNLDNLNKFEKDNEWSKKGNKEEFIKKEVIEVKTEKKEEDEIIEKKDKEEFVEKRKSGERKGSQW